MSTLSYADLVPGQGTTRTSVEAALLWGPLDEVVVGSIVLDSTTVDARSTVTTDLQAGLILGKITATGFWKQFSATATDGTQVAQLILGSPKQMLDASNAAKNQLAIGVVAGPIIAGSCGGLTNLARQQLGPRILWSDDYSARFQRTQPWIQETAKTANYTVLSTDTGTLFTNTGAAGTVNFTLPTLAAGLVYSFLVVADFTMTVTSAEGDNIVVPNDASADSISWATGGDKVGGAATVYSNAAGTKWYIRRESANALTIVT